MQFIHVGTSGIGSDASADVFHASQRNVDTGPGFHDAGLIVVVEDGGFQVTTPAGSWLARPGAIIVLGPGQVHRLRSQSPRGASYRMIQWTGYAMPEAFSRPVINDPRLALAVQQAHTLLLHSRAPAMAIRQLSVTLARLGAMHGGDDRCAVTSEEAHIIRSARRFLLERLALPVKLDAAASHCGVSIPHLVRVFRRAAGLPPHAWLTQQRVNRARAMLVKGAALADVAYACGFNDQSHLTRLFRASVGVTPGRYRRAVVRGLSRRA
jgi:AraC-like DNA-binding protein